MKSVTPYPFNLSAGQTLSLPIEGDYFRIQSATGAIDVTVDGVGTLPDLLNGQGLKNVPFKRLTLKDKTGAANAGVILVAFDEFIDNRTYGVNDLSSGSLATLRQPLAATGFFNDASNVTANTALTVFTPGSNVNGAIILNAAGSWVDAAAAQQMQGFLAKASAPASVTDGSMILPISTRAISNTPVHTLGNERIQAAQFVPAGQGLYFISSFTVAGSVANSRSAQFRLL